MSVTPIKLKAGMPRAHRDYRSNSRSAHDGRRGAPNQGRPLVAHPSRAELTAKVLPDRAKAKMHEKMAEPQDTDQP